MNSGDSPPLEPSPVRAITGMFNIWKPAGILSRKVVDDVCYALGTSRVGHAGTLDPLATGVLVVCAGQTARLVPYIQQQPKTYEADFLLGCSSDTDDITGKLTEPHEAPLPAREAIAQLLPEFRGRIEQVPPTFSAVRVRGRRAHHLARKGRKVEIAARVVEVYRIEILSYEAPQLRLLIECGSGTYVRSIGRDLGEKLGCGAVLSGLVRTRIGNFTQANAIPLDQVSLGSLASRSLPTRLATAHLPQHQCTPQELCETVQGKKPLCPPHLLATLSDRAQVAFLDDAEVLVALLEYRQETDRLHPFLVFADREEVLQQNGLSPVRAIQEAQTCPDSEALGFPASHS